MSKTAIPSSMRSDYVTTPVADGPVVLAAKPFDGSEAPLAVARWLAQREERELHLVSVLERYDNIAVAAGAPMLPPQYYDEERTAIAERMQDQLANRVKTDTHFRVDVIDGQYAQSIVELAHDRGARVIVIGTGRHDSLGRFLYGERAMQIVRLTDRPVLVVPRNASPGFVRHAAVAVDFSPASLRAATALFPMLSAGSRLTLIHAKPHAHADETGNGSAEGRCDELFKRFIRLLHVPATISVETRVVWGDPVTAIDDFARLNGVSMIACGRRQNYTLTERLFVGSVSAGLIRRVQCPVLVTPEQHDDAAEMTSAALTGVERWPREEWPEQIEAFGARNAGKRIRLSTEGEADHGGRLVAQQYYLRHTRYDQQTGVLTVKLQDAAPTPNTLELNLTDVTNFVLFTDIANADMRLTFESAAGRGTVTVAADQLP